jgi:hypothetical protein
MDWNSSKDGSRLVELCNGHFKSIWRHLLAKGTRALTLYYVRTVQPPSPLLYFVSLLQDKITALNIQPSLQKCSLSTGMDLKLILHMEITKLGKESLVKDQASTKTLFGCAGTYNVHFTPLYIGVNTWRTYTTIQDSTTIWKCQNSVEIIPHPKFT